LVLGTSQCTHCSYIPLSPPQCSSLAVLMQGKSLVNLTMCSNVPGRWVVWRSGTFPENHKQVSTLPVANTDHGMTERSTSDSLGDVSWVQKAALHLYRRNVPLPHTSTQCPGNVISFTRPSLALVSTASEKRWGEKAWV